MDAVLSVLMSCVNSTSNSSEFEFLIIVFAELVPLIANDQLIQKKIKRKRKKNEEEKSKQISLEINVFTSRTLNALNHFPPQLYFSSWNKFLGSIMLLRIPSLE